MTPGLSEQERETLRELLDYTTACYGSGIPITLLSSKGQKRIDALTACLAIDDAVKQAQGWQAGQGCATCLFAGNSILECGDLGAGRICTHQDMRYLNDDEGLGREMIVPISIDGKPMSCPGYQPLPKGPQA